MQADQVAVQMYTLREQAAEDLDATFWKLAEMGYKAVEFAGYYDNDVKDIAAMLERHGLRAPAAHIPYPHFADAFDTVLEDAKTLGYEWLIVPMSPVREASEDEAMRVIEELNGYARKVTDAGLKFAYHNHDLEFRIAYDDGTTWFDRLVANSDPSLKLELDAFWVFRGGRDAAEVIRDLGDRVKLVHIKDADPDEPSRDLPFGEGSLDWAAIIAASRAAGVEYYVVEQDNPRDVFVDVETALRNAEAWEQS